MAETLPERSAQLMRQQLLSRWSIGIGASLAAASLIFADVWILRAGVVVAVVAGVTSTLASWRHAREIHRQAQRQALADLLASGQKLRSARAESMAVLRVLEQRNRSLRSQALEAQAEVSGLSVQVSELNSENAELRFENVELRSCNAELRSGNAELRSGNAELLAELTELRSTEVGEAAEIVTLPRRRSSDRDSGAAEVWDDGSGPSVVDLQALATPFVENVVRKGA